MPKERRPNRPHDPKKRVVNASTTGKSRAAAEKAGCRFYIGEECQANHEHGNVRYTANAQCVQCERGKYRAYAARERAKRGGNDIKKRASVGFSFVAFTLGSVEGIEKWLASMAQKQGLSQ